MDGAQFIPSLNASVNRIRMSIARTQDPTD